jgi:hypothetical protein
MVRAAYWQIFSQKIKLRHPTGRKDSKGENLLLSKDIFTSYWFVSN